MLLITNSNRVKTKKNNNEMEKRILICIVAMLFFVSCENSNEDVYLTKDGKQIENIDNVSKGLFPMTYKIPDGVRIRDGNGDYWTVTGTVVLDVYHLPPFVQITHCDIILTNTRTGETMHFYGAPKLSNDGNVTGFDGTITNDRGVDVEFATCSDLFNLVNDYIINNYELW